MATPTEDLDALFVALSKLGSASDKMMRVLQEEAAWWAAGCPPRDVETSNETTGADDA